MTAHTLELLLRFFVHGKDATVDHEDFQSISMLKHLRLIDTDTGEITNLGIAHVLQLIKLPLPTVKQTTVYLSPLDNQPILPIQ